MLWPGRRRHVIGACLACILFVYPSQLRLRKSFPSFVSSTPLSFLLPSPASTKPSRKTPQIQAPNFRRNPESKPQQILSLPYPPRLPIGFRFQSNLSRRSGSRSRILSGCATSPVGRQRISKVSLRLPRSSLPACQAGVGACSSE